MARAKGYFTNVPRFYRWQTYDHIMFGFVIGIRTALPTMGVAEAIRTFLDVQALCEDVYCFETAKAAYYHIAKSLLEKDYGFDPDTMEIKKMT
jgi:hypothetical protein